MIDSIAPSRRAVLLKRIDAAEKVLTDDREEAEIRAAAAREIERARAQLAALGPPRPSAPPPDPDVELGARVAALQAEMTDPRISRTRWMECQAQVTALLRARQLRGSIAAAIEELNRRPQQPILRKRLAAWLQELKALEQSE